MEDMICTNPRCTHVQFSVDSDIDTCSHCGDMFGMIPLSTFPKGGDCINIITPAMLAGARPLAAFPISNRLDTWDEDDTSW